MAGNDTGLRDDLGKVAGVTGAGFAGAVLGAGVLVAAALVGAGLPEAALAAAVTLIGALVDFLAVALGAVFLVVGFGVLERAGIRASSLSSPQP